MAEDSTVQRIPWSLKEEAIMALEVRNRVDPLDLIEAARDPEHPCHGDFTWDIAEAAAERWRDQARSLIRKCKFEVIVEEVTQPIVRYVSCTDDQADFVSLPKTRKAADVTSILQTEVAGLLGLASRVYGIALAKQNIVGPDVVVELDRIRHRIASLKEDMQEE